MFASSAQQRTEIAQLWAPVGALALTGIVAAVMVGGAAGEEERGWTLALWTAFGQVVGVALLLVVEARIALGAFTRWEGEERAALALLFGAVGVWCVPLAFLVVQLRWGALVGTVVLGWAAGRLTRRCAPGSDAEDAHSGRWALLGPVAAVALIELGVFAVIGAETARGAVLAAGGGFVLGLKAAPALAPAPFRARHARRWTQLGASVAGAFIVTAALTAPVPMTGMGGGGKSTAARQAPGKDMVEGAILLGKRVGVVPLVAPLPPRARGRALRALRPQERMVIEFSGVYWVTGLDFRRPRAGSLIVRETPLDYRFTMTDQSWLLMQARQQLPQTINPRRYSHLEMTVDNRDALPESIMLEVELAATDGQRERRVSLGKQRVKAMGAHTLRYALPPGAHTLGTDLIIVTYHLYMPRPHRSASLAIERFAFVPRSW